MRILFPFFFLAALMNGVSALAQSHGFGDPFGMSLEELMEEPVLTAAKQEEPRFDTTSSVFVIDQSYLGMTPADTIPDMLRYTPGMVVAQGNSYTWSVSSRSNPNRFTNDLLALRDGRSIYNTIYSGVFWEVQRVILDDLERIEVVKGSGGALWGSNAVNGVINILSKPAWETQGVRFEATHGSQIDYGFGLRVGGQSSPRGYYRVSLVQERKGSKVDDPSGGPGVSPLPQENAPPSSTNYADTLALSARYDLEVDAKNFLKVELDAHRAAVDEHILVSSILELRPTLHPEKTTNEGVSLLARWDHLDDGSGSSFYLQGYLDFYKIDSIQTRTQIGIQDIEGLYRRRLGEKSEIALGGGLRIVSDDYSEDTILRLQNAASTVTIFNTFSQFEYQLTERWLVRLGTKLEYHPQTVGLQHQPTLRLLFKPNERQRLWFAASETTRTTSRMERGLNRTLFRVDPLNPEDYGGLDRAAVVFNSQPDLDADRYYAVEAGYRIRLRSDLTFEFSAYRQYMHHGVGVNTSTYVAYDPIPHLVLDSQLDNSATEEALGAEASLAWTPHEHFTLRAHHSFITRIQDTAEFRQPAPRHQSSLTVQWEPANAWSLFAGLRYQSAIEGTRLQTPARWDGDASLRWRINEHASLILRGQHLFRARRYEYVFNLTELLKPTPIERQISARLEFSF